MSLATSACNKWGMLPLAGTLRPRKRSTSGLANVVIACRTSFGYSPGNDRYRHMPVRLLKRFVETLSLAA
ncbi:MAG: hypothetical protein QOD93_4716 [Acetobacteraceae bacterium]|jgi:hypothetical protein|nr:hypothetical protein [Acetobacteraceae bacterium]